MILLLVIHVLGSKPGLFLKNFKHMTFILINQDESVEPSGQPVQVYTDSSIAAK